MPLRTLPEAVVYQGQGGKREYWQDIVVKKQKFCLLIL